MTFRCKQPEREQLTKKVGGLALLMLLCAIGATSVSAQDDGSAVPPPPKVKQQGDSTPDPDFQSPMKRRWADGNDMEQRQRYREMRRRFQNGEGFGPGMGGPGMGGPGMGGPGDMQGGPGFGDDFARKRMKRFGGPEGGFGPDAAGMGGPGGPQFGGGMRNYGPGRGGRGMGGGFGHKLDLTPLNLTEDQKNKIKQIRQANRDKAKDFRQTLMQKQGALHSLIFSPTATDTQIRAARKEVRKAQDALEEVGLDDLLQIRGVLTAEQKQRLPQIAPPPPGGRGPGTPDRTTASATTSARRLEK